MSFRGLCNTVLVTFLMSLLAGCYYPANGGVATGNVVDNRAACSNCGRVEDIDYVEGDSIDDTGAAIIGAVIGGLVGHQVGGGTGKDIATAAGAAGGAIAGQEIEEQNDVPGYYVVVIDMYSGGTRTINVPVAGSLNVGDEVRVEGSDIHII